MVLRISSDASKGRIMKELFRLFKRKNSADEPAYDRELEKPIIRASICTGEKTAGFKDLKTGRFREVMLIRNQKDLDEFIKTYGLDDVETEY